MRRIVSCSVLAAVLAGAAAAQQHPTNERGFKPELAYQSNLIDTVNLFNGNLIMTVPIGSSFPVSANLSYGFVARYSGNTWREIEICGPIKGECRIRYGPQRDNVGMGWRLSFGELIERLSAETGLEEFEYRSPDAGEHAFYDTLHEPKCSPSATTNCDPQVSGVRYTRDGTYLRMKDSGTTAKIVEFPDGQRQRYIEYEAGQWRLEWMYDVFSTLDGSGLPMANFVRFEYPPSAVHAGVSDWKLTDSHGRTHHVRFRPETESGGPDLVDLVELAAFGETTATYDFAYNTYVINGDGTTTDGAAESIPRPCDDAETAGSSTVALLTRIGLPLGQTFRFDYDKGGGASCSDTSGTVIRGILPTLGSIEWSYRTYNFAASYLHDQAVGVSERRIYDAAGAHIQFQKFSGALGWNEVSSLVRSGNDWRADFKTINYFDATWGATYGLPYTTASRTGAVPNPDGSTSGRLLSTETFDCDPAGGTCSVTPERATYVKYEMDALEANCHIDYPCYRDRNRRSFSGRTLFVSDGGRYADSADASFDGLGHYRQSSTSGNFGQGDSRLTFVDFNPSVGTYSLDASGNRQSGYTMLASSDPWVLGTWVSRSTEENGITARQLACFDPATGFQRRIRTLAGDAASPNDLLTVLTPEAGTGNPIRQESFGGDRQTLSTASLCTMSLPTHDRFSFRTDHTYQYGSLASSAYWDTTTQLPMPFRTVDDTIDRNSGRVKESRDTAGVKTTFTYDALGRLTSVSPPVPLAPGVYSYTNASGSSAARLGIAQTAAGQTIESQIEFDGLGRAWREKRLMPGGTWSTRETRYNDLGLKERVSELQATPASYTQYSGYDPFGRPATITAPDGKTTTFSYTGVRTISRTVRVGTASGTAEPETDATTTETYDRQGRLISVVEPGGNSTTSYAYHIGNRLSSVMMTAGATTQTRSFIYDRRGLLLSESHPENGTIAYGDYDARGHAGLRLVNNANDVFDLKFFYDPAERLTRLESRNPYDPAQFRVSKEFFYAGANSGTNLKQGKLETRVRYNYQPTLGTVVVSETFAYEDAAGRLTRKETQVSGGTIDQRFGQTYAYDALNQPAAIGYPYCMTVACGAPEWSTIEPGYEAGRLKTLPGFVTDIAYHANGATASIAHANGVSDAQEIDPAGMARPRSISFSGYTECAPASITSQPLSQTVLYGSSATLSVGAGGSQPVWYQWYEGSSRIEGAEQASYTTPALTEPGSYSVRVANSCGGADSAVATVSVKLAAPSGLLATHAGSGQITVSWTGSPWADHYELERKSGGSPFGRISDVSATSYSDSGLAPGTTYVYRVRAVDPAGGKASDYSNADLSTTMTFSSVGMGVAVRASDFEEMLGGVNAVRAAGGSAALTWTAILPAGIPAPGAGVLIYGAHLESLRAQMDLARETLGFPAAGYTDPVVVGTLIRAVHVTELRERMQ